MTRASALLYGGFLLLGVGLLSAQGPPPGAGPQAPAGGGRGGFLRGAGEPATGAAVIRGRIVAAGTGTPIRRAQVRAVAAETRATRIASTDADGRFELRDLPAGRWQITASKAGFVTLRFGQTRPFEAGRPIELRDAEVMDRLQIALPRGSAITGRVFDEFGDPVAAARVQVLRYQLVQGTRRLTPTGVGDQTDDTGAFRLFGLTPGQYYVSASLRALPVDDPSGDAAGYAPTYYPGTNNVGEAQAITLAVGQELPSVNFALLPLRTVRVSGMVIDSKGAPVGGGVLMLTPPDDSAFGTGFLGGRFNLRPDGTFTMSNVAPGSYTVTVSGGQGRQGGGAGEVAQLPLTVGSEDLTGLYLATARGATISGSIAAAPGSVNALPARLQVSTQSATLDPGGIGERPARIDANGAFTLTGLLGQRLLRVNGVPANWTVQSIVLDGEDITDTPIAFRQNEEIRGVRVTLTDRVSLVTGKVATASGALTRDFTVVIFPEDDAKWTPGSRYVRSGRPDQDGLFKIRALPAEGRYLAAAVNYLEDGEGGDPRFLEQIRGTATRFALGDGETRALDLKLIER